MFLKLDNLEFHGEIIVTVSPQRLIHIVLFQVIFVWLTSPDELSTKCFKNGAGVIRARRFYGILLASRA